MKVRFFLLGVCLLIVSNVFSQNINISLFHKTTINTITFKAESGKYDIISNNKIPFTVDQGDSIVIKIHKRGKFKIFSSNSKPIGKFKHILFRGKKQSNYFTVSINESKDKFSRTYDNDLNVALNEEGFQLINDVNFEKYIAGVVEAEGGPNAPIEYFKTQAILCRTYAMKHYEKHLKEGFNLCDDVHCQAFKGRCKYNPEILKAARSTAGLVIVDKNLEIISATFYANSGGETANSEDVWISALPYLRGKTDKYSLNQHGYKWTKEIKTSDWIAYLNKKGIADIDKKTNFNFSQDNRKKQYSINDKNIPLKYIRTDWGLRSTFFSIEHKGNKLILHGKGYGHGVGLSQEGAMQMAKQNYTYDDIIKYYYTGVNIMSIKALNFFQVE